jgi:hypothetical protein
LDDYAVLDVDTVDLREGAGGGIVASDELSDDGQLLGGVDGLVWSVEGGVAHTVSVEIATIGITVSAIAVCDGAFFTGTDSLTLDGTWVRGESRGDGVGFPDIHFSAARTVHTGSGVGTVSFGCPSFDVTHPVNELEILRTLRVTVSSSVLGTSLVGGVRGQTTISGHLGEVNSAVQTTRKLGNVNVESELLVEGLEQLVLGVASEEVKTRSNVFAVGVRLNKLEGKGISAGRYTVGI